MRRTTTAGASLRCRKALCVLVVALWPALCIAQNPWQVEKQESVIEGATGIAQTVWLAADPTDQVHNIRVHRYRDPGTAAKAALLYLPGTNMNGELALLDENHNLWLWLAKRGVAVYALDYRTHNVAPTKEDGFEFMKTWTMESFTVDAKKALLLAGEQSPGLPVFVAGFSRGASFAYALSCVADAGALSGVVVLDGYFKNASSLAAPEPKPLSAATGKFLEGTKFHSDVAAGIGWQARDQLMAAVASNPGGKATQDGYETIGGQLAELLYKAWGAGGLAHPIGASSGRGISKPEVLAALLAGYDRYYPAIQDVEGRTVAAVVDHPETGIDDCFGELELPVITFASSGMGTNWVLDSVYSAVRSGSKDVELHVLEGYGHLDVLVAETAVQDVYEPVLRFVEGHLE